MLKLRAIAERAIRKLDRASLKLRIRLLILINMSVGMVGVFLANDSVWRNRVQDQLLNLTGGNIGIFPPYPKSGWKITLAAEWPTKIVPVPIENSSAEMVWWDGYEQVKEGNRESYGQTQHYRIVGGGRVRNASFRSKTLAANNVFALRIRKFDVLPQEGLPLRFSGQLEKGQVLPDAIHKIQLSERTWWFWNPIYLCSFALGFVLFGVAVWQIVFWQSSLQVAYQRIGGELDENGMYTTKKFENHCTWALFGFFAWVSLYYLGVSGLWF